MKVVETAWLAYRAQVIPPDAPPIQIRETKKAFYAGAGTLLDSLTVILGPGHEPTESDLLIMDGIAEELRQYVLDVVAGKDASAKGDSRRRSRPYSRAR